MRWSIIWTEFSACQNRRFQAVDRCKNVIGPRLGYKAVERDGKKT